MASTDIDFKQVQFDFLVSALHPGLFITTDQVLEWMEEQNHIVESRIEQIPLEKLKDGLIPITAYDTSQENFSVSMAFA